MKKIILSTVALVAMMASSVFGMYAPDADWIDFLTHGNQFRARVNQFGFVLGNGTIKGTFGFKGHNVIFTDDGGPFNFNPTASAGIGYTSDLISAGLGYSFTHKNKNLSTHTPVLMLNFLNNNLRMVIPVSVASTDKNPGGTTDSYNYMGISTDTHIRYYTGMEALSQIRLYVKYGMNETKIGNERSSASSLGVDFRVYFGANVDELALNPFIKIVYNTALDAKGKVGSASLRIKAADEVFLRTPTQGVVATYDRNPYSIDILPILAITANSDVVSLYVEPGLGYRVEDNGRKGGKLSHGLAWSAYGEIYVTPLPNLEWYFEADVGNAPEFNSGDFVGYVPGVNFATSTGVTWYLPSLQPEQ